MQKDIVILFGGASPEHEVSVVTGLQAMERVDRTRYTPHVVFVDTTGAPWYCGVLQSRKDFKQCTKKAVTFGKDATGGYIQYGFLKRTIYPYVAFLAFHGGVGESGGWQGVCESFGIPHTGSTVEGSAVAMNKHVTKTLAQEAGVSVVAGIDIRSEDVQKNSKNVSEKTIALLGMPVIVKPAHLGSSIAITIAHTPDELEKALLEASHLDSEIEVEKLLTDFIEYNCAVRQTKTGPHTSPVEKPMSQDEILSFADKYQRGAKKQGGEAGMASLQREVPAQITDALRNRIQDTAKKVFTATRQTGMVRIDFMYQAHTNTLYLTEVNPIPGSLAFYLWEAGGMSFKQHITDMIERAYTDADTAQSRAFIHESDIVQKFCA